MCVSLLVGVVMCCECVRGLIAMKRTECSGPDSGLLKIMSCGMSPSFQHRNSFVRCQIVRIQKVFSFFFYVNDYWIRICIKYLLNLPFLMMVIIYFMLKVLCFGVGFKFNRRNTSTTF